MQKEKKNWLWRIWGAVCLCVTVGFFILSEVIGGAAMNGYVENGVYFVGEHGNYTQVTQEIWTISQVWGIVCFVCTWLYVISGACMDVYKKRCNKTGESLSQGRRLP